MIKPSDPPEGSQVSSGWSMPSQGEPSDRTLDSIIDKLGWQPKYGGASAAKAKADLIAWAEAGKLEARLDEVQSAREQFKGNAHSQALNLREHLGNRYAELEAERRKLEEAV